MDDLRLSLAEFKANPTNKTAARYMEVLRKFEEEDLINDDEFLDGLGRIYLYLLSDPL